MSEKKSNSDEEIGFLQKLFDSPFILLIAGTVVMFGFYTIWGLVEIMNLPKSTLP